MIETYSNNLTVESNSVVTFNTTFQKGNTVTKAGDGTIQLNKCGIYELNLNAVGIASSGGNITLQLLINGSAVPNAFSSVTATDTTSTHSLNFTTKIQVPISYNKCDACSPAFTVSIVNSGVAATYSLVNVVVTKLI